ncbi:MAG: hypothetical protein ABEJ25_02545 [Candidatus Bipolaricaulia bacterium]
MKKLLTVILISATVILTVATLGFATSDSATTTVSWTVNAQQSLQINSRQSTGTSDTVESNFNIPIPTQEDLKNGHSIIEENAIKLVATSNINWSVQVEANNASLARGADGYTLSVRGLRGFRQVKTHPVTIASGEPGRHVFGVDYKVIYNNNYKPGNHVAELVYTISPE